MDFPHHSASPCAGISLRSGSVRASVSARRAWIGASALVFLGGLGTLSASPAASPDKWSVPKDMITVLEDYCQSCHEDGMAKGGVRLDNLGELTLDARLDLMNRMQEQVFLKQMPPPKEEEQPTPEQRSDLSAWLAEELHTHQASKLEDKLRFPAYGNSVDHEALFKVGQHPAPFTPARRWLVNPRIFDERVRDIFYLEGKERETGLSGVTNPFLLPDSSGVRDYDIGMLDGGHLLVMLTNAEWISNKQIRPARVKAGEIGADEFPDPKDRWSPRTTPVEFESIILKKSAPTDVELTKAIERQFDAVLRRSPTGAELSHYLELTRSSVQMAGNSDGLRQMLVAVLLESEFLYRLEYGDGPPDARGRKLLSPREGAYAIAYAMGDRGPDDKLLDAVESGKLAARADYRREVLRLLDDKVSLRGPVDPTSPGGRAYTHNASHPKIVRFFREFFGYPMATKVFKDVERVKGVYQNPDRGTLGAPGFLVDEADRVVDRIIQADRNVFQELLTTDQYFVYHNKDNATGRQIIAEWKEVWEKLKGTPWKSEADRVIAENRELLLNRKSIPVPEGGHQKREFLRMMYFFEDSFGRGRTPFTTVATAHGYKYNHSPLYSLPPSPQPGRYGNAENPRFKGLDDMELWDYPVEQPFKIANRKGILSHPAWLIAHSQNTHNDPIKRGRWVREKLLAGRVPDIPITVDAVVPEDHQKTLRDRVESVTQAPACWRCHESMNPLGLPFEIFDDFGRFRTEEQLEHPENIVGKNGAFNVYKTLPVNARGLLDSTGDPALDGEVSDALDMIEKLAKSPRVRQSFIRHAFRFYMGRNEMLSDAQTLIDADFAYVESGGSFKAVIVSLLTSDSFLYRK